MYKISLAFVGIAAVIGLMGLSGYADMTWIGVSKVVYVVLLFPFFLLITVGFSKSFSPHAMYAVRTSAFIVMAITLLAFAM
jgi:hypothetical protein